ncbi:hypothetical protein WJX81_002562 [Elliptochloris bilobata]|uniref:J domain-containing protein n=1 Tax=Elliptochloris bilobata TaxID=381761 RepID=A0AAW1RYN0_9CHLO
MWRAVIGREGRAASVFFFYSHGSMRCPLWKCCMLLAALLATRVLLSGGQCISAGQDIIADDSPCKSFVNTASQDASVINATPDTQLAVNVASRPQPSPACCQIARPFLQTGCACNQEFLNLASTIGGTPAAEIIAGYRALRLPKSENTSLRNSVWTAAKAPSTEEMVQMSCVFRALALACLLALGACPRRSCVRQGAGMATNSGTCRTLIDSLQGQVNGLVSASDSRIRDAARSAPTPSDACCSDMRTFVEQGCACDNSLLNVLPMVNSSPDDITVAVRVAQVTTCAASWNGGSIYDPCTGSSGPGYYANRRLAHSSCTSSNGLARSKGQAERMAEPLLFADKGRPASAHAPRMFTGNGNLPAGPAAASPATPRRQPATGGGGGFIFAAQGGMPASPERRARPPDPNPNPTGSARRAAHRARSRHLAAAAAAQGSEAAEARRGSGGVWGGFGLGGASGVTPLPRAASPAECSPMDWTAPRGPFENGPPSPPPPPPVFGTPAPQWKQLRPPAAIAPAPAPSGAFTFSQVPKPGKTGVRWGGQARTPGRGVANSGAARGRAPAQEQIPNLARAAGAWDFQRMSDAVPAAADLGPGSPNGSPVQQGSGSRNGRTWLKQPRGSTAAGSPAAAAAAAAVSAPVAEEVPPPPPPPPPPEVRMEDVSESPGGTSPGGGPSEAGARRAHAVTEAARLHQRGNKLFADGKYGRAKDLYLRAASVLEREGVREGRGKLLNNLAACHLQKDHPYAALQACAAALQVEPGWVRAHLRRATCHLRLGAFEAADAAVRAAADAGAGDAAAAKGQEVAALRRRMEQAEAAAEAAADDAAAAAALVLSEDLLSKKQAPHAARALALRANLLVRLSRHADALQMARLHRGPTEDEAPAPVWPWWVEAQVAFHSGDLETAAALLRSAVERAGAGAAALPIGPAAGGREAALEVGEARRLAAELQALLELKATGNSAVGRKDWAAAADVYSAALAHSCDAPAAFAAVLHANRAAALQALGRLPEAIADCLRASALDPTYARAHSRLGALLSEVRHTEGAVAALEKLSALPGEAANAQARLRDAQALARRRTTTDHYKLLGLQRSASAEEVRRAYKRSALSHHPDKALAQCRFAARLGSLGVPAASGLQARERVREAAEWLFKVIGAAATVLGDPIARRKLDMDLQLEAVRNANPHSTRPPPAWRGPSYQPYRAQRGPSNVPRGAYTRWQHATAPGSDESDGDECFDHFQSRYY